MVPPRLFLVTHPESPTAVILRRGPTRIWHVLLWHLEQGEIESGSWFQGRIYPLRSGLSPDGRWLVYFAMGRDGEIWTGLCQPPSLRAALQWSQTPEGTWNGGGIFEEGELLVNVYAGTPRERGKLDAAPPFRIREGLVDGHGEDEGVLYSRLALGGFERAGDSWGRDEVLAGPVYRIRTHDDPGWRVRRADGPELAMYVRGYNVMGRGGRAYEFALPAYPGLLDRTVEWAEWDRAGHLLVARAGVVERWSPTDLERGVPAFRHDLTPLRHPPQEPET